MVTEDVATTFGPADSSPATQNTVREVRTDVAGRVAYTNDTLSGAQSLQRYDRFDRPIESGQYLKLSGMDMPQWIESQTVYDATDRVVQTRLPEQAGQQTHYDQAGRVIATRVATEDGGATFNTFNNATGDKDASITFRHNPVAEVDAYDKIYMLYDYDEFGRMVGMQDHQAIDDSSLVPVDQRDGGQAASIKWGVEAGFVKRVTNDRNGIETADSFDAIDRVFRSIAADTSETTTIFDQQGRVESVRFVNGSDGIDRTTTYQYDALDRVRKATRSAAGTSDTETTHTDYRFANHLHSVHTTDFHQTARNSVTANEFNVGTRIENVRYTDPTGKTVRVESALPGVNVDATVDIRPETRFSYDYSADDVLTVVQYDRQDTSNWVHTAQQINLGGWVLASLDVNEDQVWRNEYREDGKTVHTFDAADELASSYEYDRRTELVSRQTSHAGASASTGASVDQIVETLYDTNGNLVRLIDGSMNVTTRTYDASDRMVYEETEDSQFGAGHRQVNMALSTQTYEYRVFPSGSSVYLTGSYPQAVTIHTAADNRIVTTIDQPTINQTVEKWGNDLNAPDNTITTERRGDGTIGRVTGTHSGQTIDYDYDALGYRDEIHQFGGNFGTLSIPDLLISSTFARNEAVGMRTLRSVKVGGANIIHTDYRYDDNGRYVLLSQTNPAITAGALERTAYYQYYGTGQTFRIDRYDSAHNTVASLPPASTLTTRIMLDANGRLDEMSHMYNGGSHMRPLAMYDFMYDANHRIDELAIDLCWSVGCTAASPTVGDGYRQTVIDHNFDDSDQLIASDYTQDGDLDGRLSLENDFDPSGNRITGAVAAVGNRVRESGGYRYDYDAVGRRIEKRVAYQTEIHAAQPAERGISLNGNGWVGAIDAGGGAGPFNGNQLQISTETAGDTAVFGFRGLPDEFYDVYVLWSADGRTGTGQFNVVGETSSGPLLIDFSEQPADSGTILIDAANNVWRLLDRAKPRGGGNLSVTLGHAAVDVGVLHAGAVMVTPVPVAGPATPLSPDNLGARAHRTTYEYDHRGMMTFVRHYDDMDHQIGEVEFLYDPLSQRIGRRVLIADGGPFTEVEYTIFLNEDYQVLAEIEGGVGGITDRINRIFFDGPGVDNHIAIDNHDGAAPGGVWTLADYQGSIRTAVSTDGSIINIAHQSLSATGEFSKAFGDTPSLYGNETEGALGSFYAGLEFDEATGLQYNRARQYDRAINQFTSKDPIRFAAGDANLYRYVSNGPTNATDPSGLEIVIGVRDLDVITGPARISFWWSFLKIPTHFWIDLKTMPFSKEDIRLRRCVTQITQEVDSSLQAIK